MLRIINRRYIINHLVNKESSQNVFNLIHPENALANRSGNRMNYPWYHHNVTSNLFLAFNAIIVNLL